MEGSPQLTDANGDLTSMLDKVITSTGFNYKIVDSLTYSAGIAKVVINAGHGYILNQVINISNANEASYNGDHRVTNTSRTEVYFALDTDPGAATATGNNITIKTPGLGFEIAFSGTNKRAYRSTDPVSNRPYLRVDDSLDPLYTDTYAKKGKVVMTERMTDIDTITGAQAPYMPENPTASFTAKGAGADCVDGWHKWYYSAQQTQYNNNDTKSVPGNKNWVLVGDGRGFYLFIDAGNMGRTAYCFTDFDSYRQGDNYNTILVASDWYNPASASPFIYGPTPDATSLFTRSLDFTGKVIMKDYNQVGGTIRAGFMSLGTTNGQTVSGLSTGVPWPNGPDYGLIIHPTYIKQENNHIRGKMPGMMWVHNDQPMQHFDFVDGVTGYPGKQFLVITCSAFNQNNQVGDRTYANKARIVFDITGPWR